MLRRLLASRRSNVTVEFAIVCPVFLFLLFFVFEISYDLFCQEVLDSATAIAARDMQIGIPQNNGATATGATSFTSQYLCPAGFNLINCNNLYVRVEVINASGATGTCADLYNATTGLLPISNHGLELSSFTSTGGPGTGGTIGPSTCDGASSSGYCNPGFSEYVILTAIYVTPSFMNGFVPSSRLYTYNGADVRAQMSVSAFETDDFTLSSTPANPC